MLHGRDRVLAAIGVTLAAGVIIGALMIAPSFQLPVPTGHQPVGTMSVAVSGGIPVQLWYPAVPVSGAPRAAYRPDTAERSLRERLVYPLVRTSAFIDAPVAPGQHAVVLYLPGWGEKRSDNTALCEDLASRGFIVAAIDDPRPTPAMDFSSAAAFAETRRWADTKVRVIAGVAGSVLTGLERLAPSDAASAVTQAMDVKRVAAIGYSFGGASAAEAAVNDPRFGAAVNLDGWTFGDAARQGVRKPFLMMGTGFATIDPAPDQMHGDPAPGEFEAELDRLNSQQIIDGFRRYGGYVVTVDGTQHENYCDAGMLPFLRLRPVPGSIDGRRAQRIIAAYVGDFLDQTLNGRPSPLFALATGARDGTSRSRFDHAAELTVWTAPHLARRTNS